MSREDGVNPVFERSEVLTADGQSIRIIKPRMEPGFLRPFKPNSSKQTDVRVKICGKVGGGEISGQFRIAPPLTNGPQETTCQPPRPLRGKQGRSKG